MKPKKKEAPVEKKLSVKERLAAKKTAEKAPAKATKIDKKKEKVEEVTGRGRPKGVRYVLKDEYTERLEKAFSEFSTEFKQFENAIVKFIEGGNKSAAKKAREHLMNIGKSVKEFRKSIQEAKEGGLEAEPV